MKCKHCDGVGFFGNGASQFKCVYCDGTGEVEMTEQEWLQAASTEQLAEFLYDIRYDYQVPWKNKGVVEWLKQPHKPFS